VVPDGAQRPLLPKQVATVSGSQVERRRRRLILPENESEDESSGKWPLIDVQRNFSNSTKSTGLSEVQIVQTPELTNNQYM
jgi:hypothetical protein